MPEYRLHIFSPLGKPAHVTLPFDSDEKALAFITQRLSGHLMELWEGARLVKRFEAQQRTNPDLD